MVDDAQPEQNLLEQAQEKFPVLKEHDVGYKESYGMGQGYLESWPPGEGGAPDRPRPAELPSDKFGVEIYNKETTPLDVAGDIVSHKLVNEDQKIKEHYEGFVDSLKPWQKTILRSQYEHAKENEGEARSYEDWEKAAGLPAYFRGYAFKQWKNPDDFYTAAQMKKFDSMMGYLGGKNKDKTRGGVLYDNPSTQRAD